MVDALTTQNSELRTMLIKMSDNGKETTENGENRDDVVSLITNKYINTCMFTVN